MLSPPEEGHNYMIMEIPNFIAMFSTRGDLSQVINKNAGAWVRDGFIVGINLGELYVQTADVK